MRPRLIFGLIFFLARIGWADGGAIQFQGDAESLHVTVFTLPPILSVGPIDVTVLIQDRTKLIPLLDARVTFDLSEQATASLKKQAWSPPACALDVPLSLAAIPARLNHGENRLLYGAIVHVPSSGIWKLKINIQRDSEIESASTLLKVNPPAVVFVILGLLLVSVFVPNAAPVLARARALLRAGRPTSGVSHD